MDEWFELTDGSYKGFIFHVAVPMSGFNHGATDISVDGSRRIHEIKRPFVDGQRTLDLGANGETINADIVFFGETYLERFEEFKTILNEGTSGTLILPDRRSAIKATFSKITETSRAGESASKTVRVTWVQDEITQDDTASGAVEGKIPKSVIDAVNNVQNKVQSAVDTVNNNVILSTVRQFDQVVSTGVSSVVTAVSLGTTVRNRILVSVSNLENAFTSIVGAAVQIGALFGVSQSGSGFETGQVDPDTGQPIEDAAADDDVTEADDQLAAPETEPTEEIDIISLETAEGLEQFENDTIELLESISESLASDTDGRTDDVTNSITEVKNAVREMVDAASPDDDRLILTPFELSLAEIIFENDGDVNQLNEIYKKNSFIEDIHAVPKGSVIRL